jgi:hypothetical protein
MVNRREFIKSAGLLSAGTLSASLPAQTRGASESANVDGGTPRDRSSSNDDGLMVFENSELRLVISSLGCAESLIHKPTGQECLVRNSGLPMFRATQYRPYENEVQLSYPAKLTHFPVDQVRKEGDRLVVKFAVVNWEATIQTKITPSYISFVLERLKYVGYTPIRAKNAFYLDETLFVQLPVRPRKNFGDWLNVTWDDAVAVSVLATDYRTQVDSAECSGYRILQAGSMREVALEGVGAALIVTATSQLLNRIATVERDFNLPLGVESRRSKAYRYSYYQADLSPHNVDKHIKYAKMAGFRTILIPAESFLGNEGPSSWRPEYPRGLEDVKRTVTQISYAEIIPGLHVTATLLSKKSLYVTPKPDPRLGLALNFTLAQPIDSIQSTIPVEENPRMCPTNERVRLLRVQEELITYERFTTEPPYRFEGCQRGALGTHARAHERSSRLGLLDMYWGGLIRVAQNTNLQEEIAERLQDLYNEAGFKFMYYDGSEQVQPPYWFTISKAQKAIYDGLDQKPLFGEGSCKSHFSWHILTRGNAFDFFIPEEMKAGARAYPAKEAPRIAKDFTHINFGWIGYTVPSSESIGTQPDMLEYVASRAAAWDCPISLSRSGSLTLADALDAHPRTPDNLETIRRWEDVRINGWLSEAQKVELRNLNQEHTLLIDEKGALELLPWYQIENVAGAKAPGRAFVFERQGAVWVAYWHTSGKGILQLSIPAKQLTLMKEIGQSLPVKSEKAQVQLPLGERKYFRIGGLTRQQVVVAMQNARIIQI